MQNDFINNYRTAYWWGLGIMLIGAVVAVLYHFFGIDVPLLTDNLKNDPTGKVLFSFFWWQTGVLVALTFKDWVNRRHNSFKEDNK